MIAREARGARIAGVPIAPRVVRVHAGSLTSELVPGRSRVLGRLDAARAQVLGALLRRVHDSRTTATGGLPGWPSRPRTLRGYATARAQGAQSRARTPAERDLVTRARGIVEAAGDGDDRGFRFLHGDLMHHNIVWSPTGPVLVDWEFWRMGDAAEDLAYLAVMNGIPGTVMRQILTGYRATPALAARARAWGPLVLIDAALWHRAHGDASLSSRILARARAEID